ncbi:MAG: DUF4388 domain-containing protein, partial [Planctomycetota bacterium]
MPQRMGSDQQAIIDLPDLIQSLAQHGRSGTLTLTGNQGQTCAVVLRGGQVAALDGWRFGLRDALHWLRLTMRQTYAALDAGAEQWSDDVLARALVERGLVSTDGVRDAIDILIEEGFTEFMAWPGLRYGFEDDASISDWAAYQIEMGTVIAPGGLLMESVRRGDETSRLADSTPQTWDILIPISEDMGALAGNPVIAALVGAWAETRPFGAIFRQSHLPTWQATISAAELVAAGVWRIAHGEELVVFADRERL